MSHTPGPWTAEATTATGIRSFDILAGDENEWSLVATVAEVHDARLIAAAPEMLAMLKRVYKWDHVTPFGGELRALITLAEGREP